jgi:hypothetical protein
MPSTEMPIASRWRSSCLRLLVFGLDGVFHAAALALLALFEELLASCGNAM